MADNPFYMLVKAARLMNPSQFELSKDIACTMPLPGSSKRVYGRNFRSVPKKQAHELDGGLVPLPAKVCFVCNKSCRIGPLIQCDYCPLLFHMDCLNPPLTFLPTGRWMCPNHVEHFLDEYMVRTNSLSERVKLWDKYNGMVDQDSIKLRFLAKGHRKDPPFRIRVPLPPRKTVKVPDSVKEHYKNPPSLLPQPERTAQVPPEPAPVHKTNYDATTEEQEEWLTAVVSLQTSIAKHMMQKQLQKTSGSGGKLGDISKQSEPGSTAKPTASVAPVVHRDPEPSGASSASSTDSLTKVADSVVTPEVGGNAGDGGGVKSGVTSDPANGPHEQVLPSGGKSGAISLLHGNLGSNSGALNGDTEVLDVQKAKVEAAAVRTRSNSADAATGTSGLIRVSRSNTERPGGSQVTTISAQSVSNSQSGMPAASSQQQLQTPQGKNILISTINKANNTVVTKVLPSPGSSTTSKVVLPPGVAARSVSGSPPTSILSPRVLVQPSMRVAGSATSGQGSQTNGCSMVGAGPQTKVISVSTSASGSKTAAVVTGGKSMTSTLSSLPAILSLNSTLQQWIEGNSDGVPDLDLSKMDEKLLQLLAWQRLQQLLPPASPTGGGTTSPTTSGRKGLLNGLLTPGSNEVRTRAVLCPLTGKGQAVGMPYRTLSVGTGADMDVPLYQFGHCNFISSKHAVIFYDEMTRHFELLNYMLQAFQ
nr:hypothetical protein BaRGS_007848 [Batillaria attramentaria]